MSLKSKVLSLDSTEAREQNAPRSSDHRSTTAKRGGGAMLRLSSVLRRFLTATGGFILLLILAFSFLVVSAASAPLLIEYFDIETVRDPDWGLGFLMWMSGLMAGTLLAGITCDPHKHPWLFDYLILFLGGLFLAVTLIVAEAPSVGIIAAIGEFPESLSALSLMLWSLLLLNVVHGGSSVLRRAVSDRLKQDSRFA